MSKKKDRRKKRKAKKEAKRKARGCPRCQGSRGVAYCQGTVQCADCFVVIEGPEACVGCFSELARLEDRQERGCPMLQVA